MQSLRLPLSDCLDAAVTAAHAAAAILQAYAHNRGDLVIDTKTRNDLVSQADREAEQAIIDILLERTPQLGIVAEESGGKASDIATWYIDPLDGTTNFLHGIPQYAVSIALIAHAGALINGDQPLDRDTPVIGVVYDPNREELFTGLHGVGAWLNGRRIQCSRAASLAESVVGTGFPFRDFSFADEYMPTLHHAIRHTRGVRRHGAAALDLAWVACGRYDAYWEMGLAPWDVAAGTVLVREAGGICEDIFHADPWPIGGYVYAGNTNTATELDAMIQPHMKPRQSRSSQ
ncbi:inositol monophosphatase family protein [Yanghanlia caeni]|uniref:Inositol-1-monophosphatase n=1 Tax=Yanghanlia caeni TaxID=3064283 RepID=A0ABU1D7X2_9BURK|nr:inositol monophosphatase family protein [Alcaligenaceae bacterium LG-2]NGR09714.1 inositol monophosphatase [bacterium SGD-2]HZH56067.1 inositol monophosphatase family protein [Burkholderiaceae bacterium]